MFKRSSFFGVLLAALTVVMLLAVSLSATSAQDATPVPTETPIVAELGSGGLHISFWNGLTGSDGVTLNDMLAKFAAENPDISITVEMIAWNTLYQKLQTAFAAHRSNSPVRQLRLAEGPEWLVHLRRRLAAG